MAKKGRRPKAGRDDNSISRQSLPRVKKWPYSRSEELRWLQNARKAAYDLPRGKTDETLQQIEDRRTWHPDGTHRPARSFTRSTHRLTAPYDPSEAFGISFDRPTYKIGFLNPNRVLICVRRKIRRQVLHAFRIAGGSGFKKPRFSEYSRISC